MGLESVLLLLLSNWENNMKAFIRLLLPKRVFTFFQPFYHYLISITGALLYRFPSRKITVIGVTGTKGKSSTAELVNSILEEAGYTTALLNTIRFKIGSESIRNKLKMTMPGLFFIQKFLREAVSKKCTHAVIEMTSEGVKQFRHKYIDLDALIFTNIAPEHIESHGSFKKYLKAKLKLRDSLEYSHKENTAIIANIDDEYGKDFSEVIHSEKIPFSLNDITYTESLEGLHLIYKDVHIQSKLEGIFNVMNVLAAIKLAEYLKIPLENIKEGIENISLIKGRVEHVNIGQQFDVVVDYAHTPDSLEKLYETFKNKKKICVLGNTGGGRDIWKRPEMGRIAEKYCEKIILTNEDPYDEDPMKIISDMRDGIKDTKSIEIIMNRREAIHKAFVYAKKITKDNQNTIVIISGKGTDPYIMEANEKRTIWDDVTVAKEELLKLNKYNK